MTRKLIINLAAVAALSSTALFGGSAAAHPLGMNPYAPHALNGPTQSSHFSPYAPNPVIGKALNPAPASKLKAYPPIKTIGSPQSPSPVSKWTVPPPLTKIKPPQVGNLQPGNTGTPTPIGTLPPPTIIPIPIAIPPTGVDVHFWRLDEGVGFAQTAVEGSGSCLTKTYTPDAQVVFKDLCTQEAVSAPVDSAPSPASKLPGLPNYAGKTYQDYLSANSQFVQQKN